jgi:hypothetical protein
VVALVLGVTLGATALANAFESSDSNRVAGKKPGSTAARPSATTSARGTQPSGTSTGSDVCGDLRGATTMGDGMVMAPIPDRTPRAADRSAATDLVARVTAGTRKYAVLADAIAAGYVPATDPNRYIVHYADWNVVRAGDVLDDQHPSSLVYANTTQGPQLIGAMFMGPAPCVPGPDPAGPLTQWHAHDNLCLSAALRVTGTTGASGTCATGHHNVNTYFMLHVWTAPSLAASYQFETHLPRSALAAIIRSGRG